jgi:hypothetical protein
MAGNRHGNSGREVSVNFENDIEGKVTQRFNPNMFTTAPMTAGPGNGVVCTSSTCGTGTTYGTLGDASKGLLRGPQLDEVDFSINKDTHLAFLGEQGNPGFRAEFFKLFIHRNFNMPNGTVFAGSTTDYSSYSEALNSSAGRIASTSTTSRQIQLALRTGF